MHTWEVAELMAEQVGQVDSCSPPLIRGFRGAAGDTLKGAPHAQVDLSRDGAAHHGRQAGAGLAGGQGGIRAEAHVVLAAAGVDLVHIQAISCADQPKVDISGSAGDDVGQVLGQVLGKAVVKRTAASADAAGAKQVHLQVQPNDRAKSASQLPSTGTRVQGG